MSMTFVALRRSSRALMALVSVMVAQMMLMFVAPTAQAQSRFIPVAGVTTFEQEFIASTGRSRRVLYVRPVAAPVGRVPAMMVLHYGGGDPEEMANLIQVGQLVRDTGIWAIVPESSGRSWNHDPRRQGRNDADDVDLLTRIIDNAVGAYPIESTRVYMMGFSSGGFMAQRYACDRPERIAALAYVSATLLDSLADACGSNLPTATIAIHGTADNRVSYDDRVGLASAADTARFHATRNGCLGAPLRTSLPDIDRDGTTVVLDSWTVCSSARPVRFYTINGGGHTWPGNDYQAGLLGRTTQDIDATRLIWDFVRLYTR
ncbi:PHB depolymerase family esterase [Nevskia sp.]|uniref:alpha/beta hydrolase family esterase n=1 Tax=Nevskia sp. TaxID=1929292 RepID=UPI0025FFF78E|nr:PHB depolymerase family esterase [Nevskia sp.]